MAPKTATTPAADGGNGGDGRIDDHVPTFAGRVDEKFADFELEVLLCGAQAGDAGPAGPAALSARPVRPAEGDRQDEDRRRGRHRPYLRQHHQGPAREWLRRGG